MKQIYKYIAIIILTVIACVLVMRTCEQPVKSDNESNTLLHVRDKEAKVQEKKQEAKVLHDTVKVLVHHYKTIRRDSLIPCEAKLILCDTIIVKDSVLISSLLAIQVAQDSVILDWHTIHAQDSTALVKSNKEVKRQKRKKNLCKVVMGVLASVTAWQVLSNLANP